MHLANDSNPRRELVIELYGVCKSTRLCNSVPCTAKIELWYLASFAKWLSVCLRTKWFWVWVQLQSLILDIVLTFSIHGNMVYSSLPLGLLKAMSGNSINSPQNLLLVQIYYGIGNRYQFALWFWSRIFGSSTAILYCDCQ